MAWSVGQLAGILAQHSERIRLCMISEWLGARFPLGARYPDGGAGLSRTTFLRVLQARLGLTGLAFWALMRRWFASRVVMSIPPGPRRGCMAARNLMPGVIRKICLWCQGGSPKFVRECEHVLCPLHSCRLIEEGEDAALKECIVSFCLACAGSPEAVADCSADVPIGAQSPCPAHPFRMPEAGSPAQHVRHLPGLCAERGQDGGLCPHEAPRQLPCPASASSSVCVVSNRSLHDGLAAIYPGHAPEALDI